jgi:hypothetical protein
LSTRRTIGIKFLQKWNKGKLLNSCSPEEVFCFCPAIAPIVAEIFGEETEAAQRIVPPVVEIHDGASSRLERIRDGCQQGEIVSFPPNKSVQAEKAIKRALERRCEIVRTNKEDVPNAKSARLAPSIAQVAHGQVAVEDKSERRSVCKCVIAGSRRNVTQH